MTQNDNIEERVSLLEEQVVDLQDDIKVIVGDVVDLDEDVDFLFDEQIIQDERLFSLEQENIETMAQLEGKDICVKSIQNTKSVEWNILCSHFRSTGHNSGSGFSCDSSGGKRRGWWE